MTCYLDCREERNAAPEELRDDRTEGAGRELHLPELVDQDDLPLLDSCERGQGDPLEGFEIDAVAPHTRRAREADVRECRPLAGERLDREADSPPRLAQLLGDEPAQRDASFAEQLTRANGNRCLPDSRAALEQDANRLGY
jgi:hypothetical protein